MAGKQFTFRLTQEGLDKFKADLVSLGAEGTKAFNQLIQASPQLANALTRAEQAAASARTRIADLGTQAAGPARGGVVSFGSSIQQAGFQIGDFAVQVASGQSALRAFIQQGSQLLGAFGPWGAVIGAGVAVVGALVTQMGLFGSSAQDAEKAVKDLNVAQTTGIAATDLYTAALDRANQALHTQSERAADAAKKQRDLALQTTNEAIKAQQAILDDLQQKKQNAEALRATQLANPSAIAGAEQKITGEATGDEALRDIQVLNTQILQVTENLRKLQEERGKLQDPQQQAAVREQVEKLQQLVAAREGEAAALEKSTRDAEIYKAVNADLARLDLTRETAAAGVVQQLTDLETKTYDLTKANQAAAAAATKHASELEQQEKASKKAAETLDVFIDGLKRSAEQHKMTNREAAIDVELQKAEAIERAVNKTLTEEQIKLIRELAGAKYDEATADKAREDAAKDLQRAQEQAARRAAREIANPMKQAAEDIQRAFGDIFTDAFGQKPIDAALQLSDTLKRIFSRTAGEIAGLLLQGIAFGSSGGGSAGVNLGGGSSGGGGFSGGGFAGLNIGNIQNLFASTPAAYGTAGATQLPLQPGLSAGTGTNANQGPSFSFLGAGLGALAYLGDILGGIKASGPGATYGQLGSGIGGTIGSIGGAIFGPVGSMVGGALGSALGGLVGGFFSAPNNYPKAAAYLGVGANGLLNLAGAQSDNGGTSLIPQAKQLGNSALAQINALAAALGGSFGAGGLGYTAGPGGIGGIQAKAGIFNTVVGTKVESFGQDQAAAVQNFVVEVIAQSLQKGLLGGVSANVAKSVTGGAYDTLADLLSDINLGRLADGLGLLSDNAIAFQAELQKLQADFEKAKKRAADLGFQIDDQLSDQFKNARDALSAKYYGPFQDFAKQLQGGALSTLTPAEKLAAAGADYQSIKARALAGDAAAQGQFISAAQNYLTLARDQFASTESYAAIFNDVLAATRQLGTPPAVDVAPVVQAVAQSGQTVAAEVTKVGTKIDTLIKLLGGINVRQALSGR